MLVLACAFAPTAARAAPADVGIGTALGTAERGPAVAVTNEPVAAAGEGSGGVALDALERELVAAINLERATAGVDEVTHAMRLSKMADYHSREMFRGDYFDHYSLNGWTFSQRLRKLAGIPTGGEVMAYVALTDSVGATTQTVMEVLMSSGPHRAHILKRLYNRVGVSRRTGPFQGVEAAVFTIDFGRVR